MNALFRGALLGTAYGLSVTAVEFWLVAMLTIQRRFSPGAEFFARAALLEIALGALLGAALALLLRLRWGTLLHVAGVCGVWIGLERWVGLDAPMFSTLAILSPAGGLLLTLIGLWIARRWVWVPWAIGVVALVGAIMTPGIYIRLTTPTKPTRAALPPAAPGAPDVVLIVLDTVRAQNVSAYGYERPTTPTIEALAKEGALFLEATSPSTWSLPSHASLFTGLFPSGHGAHREHQVLDDGPPTLGEELAAAGYETLCFTANAWISDGLGLTRGFSWQDESWRDGEVGRSFTFIFRLLDRLGFDAYDKGGALVTSRFESWVRARPKGSPPAFVFLNFIEAHFPYHQLPDEFLHRFTTRPRRELRDISMKLMASQFGGAPLDPAEFYDPARDMYDGGILYTDLLLGRIVDALRERGSLDQTILVVLGDHGELLGERDGFFGHGASLYEEVIHVPLLLRYPTRVPAGARVAEPVSTVGVYATILELAGLEPAGPLQVGSLLPVIEGRPGGGPVLAELYAMDLPGAPEVNDPLLDVRTRYRAYRVGTKKLVETSDGPDRLFDLAEGETRDLASEQPEEVARLKAELDTWRRALGIPSIDAPIDREAAPELDPAARERLRNLGYVE